MNTNRLFAILTMVICSLLFACNEEEFPSTIPSKPHAFGLSDGSQCMGAVTLQGVGSNVEDDLKVEYVYYISADGQNFDATESHVSGLKPNAWYWWYVVAVSKDIRGNVVGTSEPSDIYTFYCIEDPSDPTVPHKHSIKILIIGDTEGAKVSSEQLVGMSGDVISVKLTLNNGYEVVSMTSGELSADGTLKLKVLNRDYNVVIEVRKSKNAA